MGEDDIVELLWKSGQVVQRSQRPTSDNPSNPLILHGSGSGGGERNAPIPQPPSLQSHQNLFIQEDEMTSWLYHPLRSELLYSGGASNPATHPHTAAPPLWLAPPPPSAPYGQIFPGGRVEAGPSMQAGSSATPSSSATESCVVLETEGTESRVSRTFAVPVCEIAGTEPIQIQPATETEIADDRKRKEREETIAQVQSLDPCSLAVKAYYISETEEAGCSTSRKRSRAAEMHNISERRRREKITEKMKALQELIPRCNKSDRASMLDDVIEYVKSLQMQIQMMSMGHGIMPPMMYAGNMQQFMPHMAMGMVGMNRPPFIPFPGTPFPRPAHTVSLGPSYPALHFPFPNVQASDPSRVQLQSPQPNPLSNQPQFPAYMNPYSQYVGLRQMQQPPPPLQSQTTSQLSFGQASSSNKPDDQDNQPTG